MIYNQIYAKYSFSFTQAENTLEIVDKYKYLGLWCSNNKNIFVRKHSYLAEQARKAIFTIRNYSHNLGHLTPKLSLKVFQAQIEPILMYGSEVLFIGKEILDFETVHLSFLKNMLGVKQQTTSVTIYGDTSLVRLHRELVYLPKANYTEFDSLSNNDKFIYIMSSTHRPLVGLHLFSNLKHATYRLIRNSCYYVTLLSGAIISHLFLYHPYFMSVVVRARFWFRCSLTLPGLVSVCLRASASTFGADMAILTAVHTRTPVLAKVPLSAGLLFFSEPFGCSGTDLCD